MLSSLYSPSVPPMKVSRTLILPLAVCCALAFGAAACGGDDDTQASEPTPAPAETRSPAPEPSDPAPAPAEVTPAEPAADEADPAPPPESEPDGFQVSDTEVPTPTSVPAGAIAIVGAGPVEQAAFDALVSQREASSVGQGGEFPAVGTPEYEALKNQIVDFLVQREQFEQEADAVGVTVTEEEVEARLDELKQQFFEGDEGRYEQELTDQGLTQEQVLEDIRFQMLTDALYEQVTENVVVGDEEIEAYYDENIESFLSPESREVAHILVETKEEADELATRIAAGEDFAQLAEENSLDEGTAANGGQYTAVRGLSVPEFDEVAYALETGETSDPVETQFGWHIIRALEDATPAETQPLEDVRDQIESLIRTDKESAVVDAWLAALQAKYIGKVLYAPGFEPPPSVDEEATAGDGAEESTP